MANLYEYVPPEAGSEHVEVLLQKGGVRIERIVSVSARTDWYDQSEDEWVVLLDGSAELEFETGSVTLRRGDMLLLEAHRRHRVRSTSENALWLAVFVKGRV